MFVKIFLFEIKAWLKTPVLYLIGGAFFLLPLFLFLGTGGYFDEHTNAASEPSLFINSPFQITSFLQSIGKPLVFLLPVVVGSALFKDFQHGMFHLIYSYPVRKGVYLGAKFTSSFLLIALIALMPLLALVTGETMLGKENPYITSTTLNGYLYSYFFILLPNLLVFGILVFSVVGLFRNIYAGFLLAVFMIASQFAIENLFHQSSFLVALFDPFGQHASMANTRFWTLSEKNSLALSITEALIYNRILWMSIGLGTGLLMYWKFSLSQFGCANFPSLKRSVKHLKADQKNTRASVQYLHMESGFKQKLLQLYTMVRHQVVYVVKHWIFIGFSLMGVLLLVFILNKVLYSEDMVMLPLTRLILEVPAFFSNLMIVFSTFILSGMIVLRAKDAGMEPILFSTPTPTTIIVSSNAVSLVILQLVQLSLLLLTGVTIQVLSGYYPIELSEYFFNLFVLQAPVLAVWALLSVFVFSITRNLYLGMFLLSMAWLAQFGYEQLGITSKLLQFNSFPLITSSAFDGYGPMLTGRLVMQAYWLLWGLLLLFAAIAFWPRIQTTWLKGHWRIMKIKRDYWGIYFVGILLLSIGLISAVIYKAEKQVIKFSENQQLQDVFQTRFDKLTYLPQPRIISVTIQMDIFPEKHEFIAHGEYLLVNKTAMPIDTLLVKTSIDEITHYQIGVVERKVDSFPEFNFSVHQLNDQLLPGDTMSLQFTIRNLPNTLFQKNSSVLANGTFLKQDILPRIGYFLNQNIPNPEPEINHYQSWDSDLVSYEATLSTSADQRAFSNGKLAREWHQDGRNFYSFKTPEPIKFNFHFNSGRYASHLDDWKNTPIRIYHLPEHNHNTKAIAAGVKSALEFNNRLFGTSPKGEISVIEYPASEGSASTLKTNSIVMSEVIFGINSKDTNKINLPFYVAAHEMTHHWFGNKLIPEDAKGALFLTESITEYLTLQMLKEAFGADAALNFLKVQHQRYFKGRANERREENSLCNVEPNQDYLSYGKGSVALNAISHALGADVFHRFLSDFTRTYRFPEEYPSSYDFFDMLNQITPDTSKQLIDELLKRSVVYECELVSANLKKTSPNNWVVNVNYKSQAFEQGNPVGRKEGSTFELGVYNRQGALIALLSMSSSAHQKTILIEHDSEPYFLVLDPNYLVLDKNRSNNRLFFD